MRLEIPKQQFRLTEKQHHKLHNQCSTIISQYDSKQLWVNKRLLAKCIGYLQSCSPAL